MELGRPPHYSESVYTGIWSTRRLGSVVPVGENYTFSSTEIKRATRNTWKQHWWILLSAILEMCIGLTLAALGLYHWIGSERESLGGANLVLIGGAAAWIGLLRFLSFLPGYDGRVLKIATLAFQVPAFGILLQDIPGIVNYFYIVIAADTTPETFNLVESILILAATFCVVFNSYPTCAYGAITSSKPQSNSTVRGWLVAMNGLSAVIAAAFVCVLSYGVNLCYKNSIIPFAAPMQSFALALPTVCALLVTNVASFLVLANRARFQVLPYVVVAAVCVPILGNLFVTYVAYVNDGKPGLGIPDDMQNVLKACLGLDCAMIATSVLNVLFSIQYAYA